MVSVVNATGNQDIDGILWGWKWDTTSLTYSFPTSTAEYSSYTAINGFEAFNATQQASTRAIFANIASFTNLSFSETTGTGAFFRFAEATSINYTNNSAVAGHTGLHTIGTAEANPPELSYGGNAPYSPGFAQGDSWYNHTSYNNPLKGSFAYSAGLMHETGHNLGLKHGHNTQNGHGYTFPTLPADHNSYEYSVMTYNTFVGDTVGGDNALDHPTTYMQNDILALQYMYGANYTYNAGATTYQWSTTSGEMFVNGLAQGAPDDNFILMTIWDGGGVDTYDFSNYATNVTVDLSPGAWSSTGLFDQIAHLGTDSSNVAHYARGNIANAQLYQGNTASLIENATGGSGNDTLTGNGANNVLSGNSGADTLVGLAGNDTFYGGAGGDVMRGFSGDDSYYVETKGDFAVSETEVGDGNDIVYTSITYSLTARQRIETLSAIDPTATTALFLAGNEFANTLLGNAGNNGLDGKGGGDVMRGYAGNDTYYVDSVGDFAVSETGIGDGNDTVLTTITTSLTAHQRIETLAARYRSDTTVLSLSGNEFGNTVRGNDGTNSLDGKAAADLLYGYGGNDTYYVDNGGDRVFESAGAGTDRVRTSVHYSLSAGQEVEFLSTRSTATTTAINLVGNSAQQTIQGNNGTNFIDGKQGVDHLYGYGGKDYFAFSTTIGTASRDFIADFSHADDSIRLKKSVFSVLPVGALTSAAFKDLGDPGAKLDSTDRIIYNDNTGALYYDRDGNGTTYAAVQFASLTTKPANIDHTDFTVYA